MNNKEKKLYVIMKDGQFGYVDHMCKCDKCKERGMYEVFINYCDGQYLDCIRLDELSEDIGFCTTNTKVFFDHYFKWYEEMFLKLLHLS